jgi:hypothetical protein
LSCPKIARFSSALSSRSFIALHFTCESVIHFESVYVNGISFVSKVFWAWWMSSCPRQLCWKMIFIILYYYWSFDKDQLTLFNWIYFQVLYSALFIDLSILWLACSVLIIVVKFWSQAVSILWCCSFWPRFGHWVSASCSSMYFYHFFIIHFLSVMTRYCRMYYSLSALALESTIPSRGLIFLL